MIRAALAIALLTAPAAAQAQVVLTLAQAKAMPLAALAARVLGPEASRDVIDAKIWGNGGGMIASPGLNAIEFYRTPQPTSFPGLCKINRLYADFASGGERGSDPPHMLEEVTTGTFFALLAHPGDCTALTPLADRDNPRLFTLGDNWNEGNGDSPERAYFGVLAITKAQAAAATLGDALRCVPDPADERRTECANPLKTVKAFPLTRISSIAVDQCEEDLTRICVTATYDLDPGKHENRTITLTVTTDVAQADPVKPFNVTAVTVGAETWAND